MFDQSFAVRLRRWATVLFFSALGILVLGAGLAYGLDQPGMAVEVVGHWFIALGAFGVKVGYIARLAALDVLEPDPEGWTREAPPPARLERLGTGPVNPPCPRRHRA